MIEQRRNEKLRLLLFFKESTGEFHVGLPLVEKLKEQFPNARSYVVVNQVQLKKIHPGYLTLLDKVGLKILPTENILSFLLRNFFAKTLLLTCTSGHTKHSRLAALVLPRVTSGFFVAAYQPQSTKFEADKFTTAKLIRFYHSPRYSRRVVFSAYRMDAEFFKSIGFSDDEIVFTGAIGYSRSFVKRLNEVFRDESLEQIKTKFKKTVLVCFRDVHSIYLSKDNHDYQNRAIMACVQRYPDYLFIFKLHPRQDVQRFSETIGRGEHLHNVVTVTGHVMYYGSLADLVITYWSSCVMDALAIETPVIEFHRFHEHNFENFITEKGQVVSYHTKAGYCQNLSDEESLLDFLAEPAAWERGYQLSIEAFRKSVEIDVRFGGEIRTLLMTDTWFCLSSYPLKLFELCQWVLKSALKRLMAI